MFTNFKLTHFLWVLHEFFFFVIFVSPNHVSLVNSVAIKKHGWQIAQRCLTLNLTLSINLDFTHTLILTFIDSRCWFFFGYTFISYVRCYVADSRSLNIFRTLNRSLEKKITLNVEKPHITQIEIKTSLQARFLLTVYSWNFARIFLYSFETRGQNGWNSPTPLLRTTL